MGQKVHPYAFRLGSIRTWHSKWYSDKKYTDKLQEDIKLRKFLDKKLVNSGVSKVEIHRSADQLTVTIHTSKPGILIGRSGASIEKLKEEVRILTQSAADIKVFEVRKPELNAALIGENIAQQIEKRISYRRAAKSSIKRAKELGAKGIKVIIAGRLNGADIARSETFKSGNIPLHTIRADIDFATTTARTTYGAIGLKIWVYHGMVFDHKEPELAVREVSHGTYDRPKKKYRRLRKTSIYNNQVALKNYVTTTQN